MILSLFVGNQLEKQPACISCQLKKQSALPFNNSESIASASFDLIHSDVWGPSLVPTMSGLRYFLFLLMIIHIRLRCF
jgi:hypothetical protein